MGSILRLDSGVNIQTFPGATFEIVGDVPAPQCSEARLEGTEGRTDIGNPYYRDYTYPFAGYDLTGKILHVLTPPSIAGDYTILSNSAYQLNLEAGMPDSTVNSHYYVSDGGELILTRDVPSFAAFIHAQGWAYTIKGGKLYTNMPSGQLKDACTILFDPIT